MPPSDLHGSSYLIPQCLLAIVSMANRHSWLVPSVYPLRRSRILFQVQRIPSLKTFSLWYASVVEPVSSLKANRKRKWRYKGINVLDSLLLFRTKTGRQSTCTYVRTSFRPLVTSCECVITNFLYIKVIWCTITRSY